MLDEKGLADQRGSGTPSYFSDTLKGQGIETWHPQFSYYGFRYLQVEARSPEGKAAGNTPALVKIEGQFIRSSSTGSEALPVPTSYSTEFTDWWTGRSGAIFRAF